MKSLKSAIGSSTKYDEQFASISHFQLYPELYPWVGDFFGCQLPRILILGESHYLRPFSEYHHDATAWYAGIDLQQKCDKGWINTRGIIANGLRNKWRGKSKTIYRNIEAVAADAGLGALTNASPFHSIAFMNYFQRPAQIAGKSIVVSSLDKNNSAKVLNSVLKTLSPQIVVFCSVLAWENAQESVQEHQDIRFAFTTHPATRWWHTPMRKYKNKSGRQIFLETVQNSSLNQCILDA